MDVHGQHLPSEVQGLTQAKIPSIFSNRHPTEASPSHSDGSSGSAESAEEKRCFELHKTKHKIFLSHSGAEKNFVEQLCFDLEKCGYFFPFFDQRSHSLPKGKTFPDLILEAAKLCHVAVIVLSETFLKSKWPMIELGEFYKARSDGNRPPYLLPLFFKLSIEDLNDQSIEENYMPEWKKFAEVDKRIDLNLWKKAVKALLGTNGLIFEHAKPLKKPSCTNVVYRSEVQYRRAITREILNLSPSDLLYGSRESMAGYDRLCKMLSSQFVEDPKTGVLQLGLYGMPGLGKTTISKALCDYFHTELMGRVCRVEFSGEITKFKSREELLKHRGEVLERQKEVLKKLWGLEGGVLKEILDIDQARTLMRDYLKRDREVKQPILLVLDNVGGDQYSVDEARAYLEAGFCPQSRIMLTSRGRKIVELLLSNAQFCKPVPNLTDEEARTFFLGTAAYGMSMNTLTDADSQRILGLCVNQCRFSVDREFQSDAQYHPLALKALANFCRNQEINNKSLSSWERYMEDFERRSYIDMFDILELQFRSLEPKFEQNFFLDIALFGEPTAYDWWSWLEGLHDMNRESVKRVMQKLETHGILNGDGEDVYMHQLYREFALWFVTEGNLRKNEWCVRDPCGRMMRIRIVNLKGTIPKMRLEEEWRYLLLLQLHSCTSIKVLNLEKLEVLQIERLIEA